VVWDERPGSADRRIGQGQVYRVDARRGVDQLEIKVRAARGASLRVEVEDGDSPPLEGLRVAAVVRRPVVLFDLPAAPDGGVWGTLRFGGGRAHRPRYDLSSLLLGAGRSLTGKPAEAATRLYDPAELAPARLGAIRPNPFFDATPALSFAMHPGAEIDPRIYTHLRPIAITPSEEGLSRLQLAPEDVARSRADLVDLRVVDEHLQQWPYLMQRDARKESIALEWEGPTSRKRRSTYRLDLPAQPLRLDRITLRSDAPFFDRSYRLLAIDGDREEREVCRGRLVQQARDPKPVRISFPPQAIHGLDLVVDDGDDAALRFESVRARVRLPELFLVAPEGRYALLIGNPDVAAPRYELERVRNVVLAVSSNPATPGDLEPNPAYSVAARLGAEDGPRALLQQGAVWSVLLAAVAILGVLTLRIARQEPAAPSDTAED
jgi:hypothetical protein